MSPDDYFGYARQNVRNGYRLWAAKILMKNLQKSVDWPDELVSKPEYYALKNLILELEGKMN